jgi:threonine synthase
MAQQLGLPVSHFIASTNANRVVPNFMIDGRYEPLKSVATISNAMDVGDPSNFIRIREIYKDDFSKIKENLSSYSFSDEQTKAAMLKVYSESGYIMDPHGAVGYLGLKHYLKDRPNSQGIFLETAHPVKFLEVVEPVIGTNIELPAQIKAVMDQAKKASFITKYDELKQFLLD